MICRSERSEEPLVSVPNDYHIHTTYSCDAKALMGEMCQAAVTLRLHEIGFAEHYDLNPVDECYDWFKAEAWYAELEQCRSLFKGRLTIRAGIEFSEPHCYPQGVQSLLDRLPFDYVIGSLHYLGAELVFSQEYFRRRTADQAFQEFFTELERMTATGDFDILGHLDVLALTAKLFYGSYDPCRYEDAIRAVLRNCIQRGIVLETNSQGLRKPAQILVPGAEILRWYVEMGGESFCLGSDAHVVSHLGMHLDVALQTARDSGLKTLTCFEKRKKQQVPLTDFT
jgi:histidinol-phosphatase (PHP family)